MRAQGIAAAAQRSPTVLVVDDDARICQLLGRYLRQHGMRVLTAQDVQALGSLLSKNAVDLLVLDVMMPGESGLSICRRMRAAHNRTPVIMLTARGEDKDRIAGLDGGADDYLVKPFNPRELLARIHAVLRRRPAAEIPGAPSGDGAVFHFGAFRFDLGQRTLHKHDSEIALTTTEFAMLKAFVRHPRQPLTRQQLSQLARGRPLAHQDRSLDVQISRLRKHIEDDYGTPRYIQTVWGTGYVFVPDGSDVHFPMPALHDAARA